MTARALALVFTDLVGSTSLKARVGDAAATSLIQRHKALVRALCTKHRGREIDNAGDGFFLTFDTPSDAVSFALRVQLAHDADRELPAVRIGAHIGEVLERRVLDGSKPLDVEGLHVDLAARIQGLCEPGQILVSSALGTSARQHVRRDVDESSPVVTRDVAWLMHGAYRFKGFEDTPIDIMEPGIAGISPLVAPKGSAKAQRDGDRTRPKREIPVPVTRMFGREADLIELRSQLERARLLTLLGAGGAGKSRLALQLANDLEHHYDDGAVFVELAPLDDGALVAQAVCSALGLPLVEGRSADVVVLDDLRTRKLLLVLDNCEHLVDAAARFTDRVLRAAPGVRVVATSREALGIAGEIAWRVPPIEAKQAVALFVDRASAVAPSFALNETNGAAIAKICARLDGIPLAIELAAARVTVLGVEQIQSRLDDRFRLLGGGSRTAMPRQQTLRATVDWSYELLSNAERTMLRRLSVFAASGFTLEAAEHVCISNTDPDALSDALTLLAQLVNKSLVTVDADGARYRLLETIRDYAREKLVAAGTAENEAVRWRHVEFFEQLALNIDTRGRGPERPMWDARAHADDDNIRAAITFAVVDAPRAQTIASSMTDFWRRTACETGIRVLTEVLAAPSGGTTTTRGRALIELGGLKHFSGEFVDGQRIVLEGLALVRESGDKRRLAHALSILAHIAPPPSNIEYGREAVAILQECGGTAMQMDLAFARGALMEALRVAGDFEGAAREGSKALADSRAIGSHEGIGYGCFASALIDIQRGDVTSAKAYAREALATFGRIGSVHGTAMALIATAAVASANGAFVETAHLLGASGGLLTRERISMPESVGRDRDRCAHAAREAIGAARFDVAYDKGATFALSDALAYATTLVDA